MTRMARFEKVSFERFTEGCTREDVREIYDAIKLPVRATKGSAGYDFYIPYDLTLQAGESALIPTGIRVCMEGGWMLQLYPRSGLGFKYRLQLNNTVGIVDSDYYYGANDGHIFCKITNDSREGKTVALKRGDAFCQGIFVPYGITYDDACEGVRTGGFGSTDQNSSAK